MSPISDSIRFYRDCYRADRRSGALLDLFARKIEHLHFLPGPDEILRGFNPVPVPRKVFGDLAAAAALYALEKTVVFGAFVIVARTKRQPPVDVGATRSSTETEAADTEVADTEAADTEAADTEAEAELAAGGQPADLANQEIVAAPLWLHPATVSEEDGYPEESVRLQVDLDEVRPNTALLASILGSDDLGVQAAEQLTDLVDSWASPEGIAGATWPSDCAQRFAEALGQFLPELRFGHAHRFPELGEKASVREAVRAVRNGAAPTLMSIECLALVPRSYETRGILHELGEIADNGETSPPLTALFAGGPREVQAFSARAGEEPDEETDEGVEDEETASVPASLSRAQQRAVISARRHPVTLVIGPPGTGKTFTLASLALDHVQRGESVLVVARTRASLDVLRDKIATLAGSDDLLIEGGRGRQLQALKNRLRHLLHGGQERSLETDRPLPFIEQELRKIRREVAQIAERLGRQEDLELEWGQIESRRRVGVKLGLGARLGQRLRSWQLGRLPPAWTLTQRFLTLLQQRIALDADRLKHAVRRRRESALERHRDTISGLDAALRAQQSSVQSLRFEDLDLDVVLGAFPIWSARFSDLHRLLPRRPELFDLVIIDEATQCDLASPIPALLRARRAVVTGDPKQLRHLSFLSVRHEVALAERNDVMLGLGPSLALDPRAADRSAGSNAWSYRNTSLLDLAGEAIRHGNQAVTLDEHFRSSPQIIGFSNREFYRGGLRVMSRRPATLAQKSLIVERISGERQADGRNPIEAEAVVTTLLARIAAERDRPAGWASTIGVLSPFRDQVDHLAERIGAVVPAGSLERHQIRIGTPYAFQGDERDVMLLSLAVDAHSPAGAFRYLDRPDVFNVAITRARNFQTIFCSFDPLADRSRLVGRYLEYALRPESSEAQASDRRSGVGRVGNDPFLREVEAALTEGGAETWPRFAVAGIEIDLLASWHGRIVGLDLVGYPGAMADRFDLERYRILQRSGLDLIPISFSTWIRDRELCLDAIEQVCSENERAVDR